MGGRSRLLGGRPPLEASHPPLEASRPPQEVGPPLGRRDSRLPRRNSRLQRRDSRRERQASRPWRAKARLPRRVSRLQRRPARRGRWAPHLEGGALASGGERRALGGRRLASGGERSICRSRRIMAATGEWTSGPPRCTASGGDVLLFDNRRTFPRGIRPPAREDLRTPRARSGRARASAFFSWSASRGSRSFSVQVCAKPAQAGPAMSTVPWTEWRTLFTSTTGSLHVRPTSVEAPGNQTGMMLTGRGLRSSQASRRACLPHGRGAYKPPEHPFLARICTRIQPFRESHLLSFQIVGPLQPPASAA